METAESTGMSAMEKQGRWILLTALAVIGVSVISAAIDDVCTKGKPWLSVLPGQAVVFFLLYRAFRGGGFSLGLIRFVMWLFVIGLGFGAVAMAVSLFVLILKRPPFPNWQNPDIHMSGVPTIMVLAFLAWAFLWSRAVKSYIQWVRYEESGRSFVLPKRERAGG